MSSAKIAMSSTQPAKATPAPKPRKSPPAATSATIATAEPAVSPATQTVNPKQKLVRDSFTIPKSEYAVLEGLKARAAKLMRPVKKGELLRAGINALHKMTDKAFLLAVDDVPSLKTGRPKAVTGAAPQALKK